MGAVDEGGAEMAAGAVAMRVAAETMVATRVLAVALYKVKKRLGRLLTISLVQPTLQLPDTVLKSVNLALLPFQPPATLPAV